MKLNKFIFWFLFTFFLSPFLIHSVYASVLQGVMTPVMVDAYINQYGFDGTPTDPEAILIKEIIDEYVAQSNLAGRDPEELNELYRENSDFRNAFLQEAVREVDEETTHETYNPQPIPVPTEAKSDPTKADFQIVQPECIGDQVNNKNVQGRSVKDSGYCGWRDLIALMNRIIKFFVYIAAALSTIAFAYAGFLYMTAFGNSGKIEEAHGIFKKTFIGILFVLMGWLLVYTLLQVFGVNQNFSILKQP